MPRYNTLEGFMREWAKLTPEQKALFEHAWRTIVLSIKSGHWLPGPPLVEKMSGFDIYEVRWAGDGRATFHVEHDADGENVIIWRHIGDHHILRHP